MDVYFIHPHVSTQTVSNSLSDPDLFRSFMRALKAQGISRDDLPYKAPFQPYGSWFALISAAIITLFKGFDTFIPFTKATFVT